MARKDASDDGWRDDDQQKRAAGRGYLLTHRCERRHTEASAVVLLRDVHAEVAATRERVPQLERRLAGGVDAARVIRTEASRDRRDGLTQHRFLLGGHELQGGGGERRHEFG